MFVRRQKTRDRRRVNTPQRGNEPRKTQLPSPEQAARIALQKVEEVMNMPVQREIEEPVVEKIEEPMIVAIEEDKKEDVIIEAESKIEEFKEEAPKKPTGNKNKKKNKTEKPAPEVNETIVSEEEANG